MILGFQQRDDTVFTVTIKKFSFLDAVSAI